MSVITNWDDLWSKKGDEKATDLKILNGFDICNFKFTAEDTVNNIIKYGGISKSDKILEIGSGAGRLAEIFLNKKYDYYAVERCESLVNKFKLLVDKNKVEINKTNILPFKDKSFDIVFCWSVIQYLDSMDDFHSLSNEMIRVSKKCILLGDIYECEEICDEKYKYKSTNLTHLVIPKKMFENIYEKYEYKICNFNNSSDIRYNGLLYLK